MIRNLLKVITRKSLLLGVVICLAISYACQEDLEVRKPQISGDEILFSVESDSNWTKSRSAQSQSGNHKNMHFLTMLGSDSLYLQLVEEENNSPIWAEDTDSAQSRGASLLSASLNKFYLTAFLDANNTYTEYMKNQEVELKDEKWVYSPIKYWPQDQKQMIHFFGFAQSLDDENTMEDNVIPTFTVTNNGFQGTFSYILPEHTDLNRDAESQSDLVFAITPNQNKKSGAVQMDFKHALSAIVFKIGTVPANLEITTITFANIYSGGECSMELNESNGIDFTWNNDGYGKGSYTQTFNADANMDQNLNDEKQGTCFMMIPQKLPDDAMINIQMTINGSPYSIEKKLNDIMPNQTAYWVENKKYIYTISLPDEVFVFVDDDVDANEKVKSDLVIKNTGLSPIYVRATIVGSWVVEKNVSGETIYEIVGDWQETDGEFDWGDEGEPVTNKNVRNWRKGSDDFYYYMLELQPGTSIPDKLFNTYTLTVQSPPVAGAYLDLTIAVQAIQVEDLNNVWPDEITGPNGLNL